MDQSSCRCIGRQKDTTVIFDNECPKVVDRFRWPHLFKGIVTFGSSGDFVEQSRMFFDIHVLGISGLIVDMRACGDIVSGV